MKCIITDCKNEAKAAKGYCYKHYMRFHIYGDPHFTQIIVEHPEKCTIKGCENKYLYVGLCKFHYYNTQYQINWRKNYRKINRKKLYIFHKKWDKKNPGRRNKADRDRIARIKKELLNIMGNKCICCGVSEWWNLTFNHIKPLKGKNRIYYEQLLIKLLKSPKERNKMQVMCFGCNNSKKTGEKCQINH